MFCVDNVVAVTRYYNMQPTACDVQLSGQLYKRVGSVGFVYH